MTATEELQTAAKNIRIAVARVESANIFQSTELRAAIDDFHTMGFSRAPLALLVADLLEAHADDLRLLGIRSDESIALAQHINTVVTL